MYGEKTDWTEEKIVQGDRIKPNGEFGSIQPALVNVTSFGE